MKHTRFMVIDPNDGMIVMLAHGIKSFSGDLSDKRTDRREMALWGCSNYIYKFAVRTTSQTERAVERGMSLMKSAAVIKAANVTPD